LDSVLDGISGRSRVSLLFMDSCRDNPFTKKLLIGSRSISRAGLGQIDSAVGTLIAFSTAPGRVAEDGDTAHSPFTQALLDNIEQSGVEVRRMMSNVRRQVREATAGRQIPWENSALEGDFYFKPPASPSTQPTGTPPPATQNQANAAPPTSLQNALMGTFLAGLPSRSSKSLEPLVQLYDQGKPNKAQAVAITTASTWYVHSRLSPYLAEQPALEGCQIRYAEPCALVALNEIVMPPTDKATWARRDMPRVNYAGNFDPEQVPAIWPDRRTSDDVKSYVSATGSKAAALHPWGTLFIKTNASSPHDAELDVLSRCNGDPSRGGKDGPCFLYAIGNHIVLPQRMTVPHEPAKTIVQAVSLVTDPVALQNYTTAHAAKAFVVEPESGRYYWWDGESSKENAENSALVGCQLNNSRPCILIATNDELRATDPIAAGRHDMAELHYKGPFQAEKTPLLSSGNRQTILSYAKLPGPKALAIRPYHSQATSATGATVVEAQQKALDSCKGNPLWPCFIYAVNDDVVISERRTEARK
jgi:Caspase domain